MCKFFRRLFAPCHDVLFMQMMQQAQLIADERCIHQLQECKKMTRFNALTEAARIAERHAYSDAAMLIRLHRDGGLG